MGSGVLLKKSVVPFKAGDAEKFGFISRLGPATEEASDYQAWGSVRGYCMNLTPTSA
jgi:hypothetical protein